ncbi:MAG: hypothetical protein ABIV28_01345 [Longimicrobiales bacterium]
MRRTGGKEDGPEAELKRGIKAAQTQDYAKAREILEPLYRAHYMDETGRRALMALTLAELDPRNATRRLYAASDFATSLIKAPLVPFWEKAAAETLYLLSIELGGLEQEMGRVEAAKDSAYRAAAASGLVLPSSTRESWPTQLRRVRDERDALTKRVETLTGTLRTRDRELADAKQELERIKKTLKIR